MTGLMRAAGVLKHCQNNEPFARQMGMASTTTPSDQCRSWYDAYASVTEVAGNNLAQM
jgi:hypothetical protein